MNISLTNRAFGAVMCLRLKFRFFGDQEIQGLKDVNEMMGIEFFENFIK